MARRSKSPAGVKKEKRHYLAPVRNWNSFTQRHRELAHFMRDQRQRLAQTLGTPLAADVEAMEFIPVYDRKLVLRHGDLEVRK